MPGWPVSDESWNGIGNSWKVDGKKLEKIGKDWKENGKDWRICKVWMGLEGTAVMRESAGNARLM